MSCLREAVVPQAEHDIDQELPGHGSPHHHRAGHAQVTIGMTPIHQRRQSETDRCAVLGSVALNALNALTYSVSTEWRMLAMKPEAAHGDDDDVILWRRASTCHVQWVWRGEPGLPHSTGQGMPYGGQDGIDLRIAAAELPTAESCNRSSEQVGRSVARKFLRVHVHGQKANP